MSIQHKPNFPPMTKDAYRKKLIQIIHVAKNKLGLDDDTYRALLEAETGRRSCSHMSIGQLKAVRDALQAKGFKIVPKEQQSPKSRGRRVDKLRAVWITMHQAGVVKDGSEQALLAWVVRTTAGLWKGRVPLSLDWVEGDHKCVNHALESLKKWAKREGVKI